MKLYSSDDDLYASKDSIAEFGLKPEDRIIDINKMKTVFETAFSQKLSKKESSTRLHSRVRLDTVLETNQKVIYTFIDKSENNLDDFQFYAIYNILFSFDVNWYFVVGDIPNNREAFIAKIASIFKTLRFVDYKYAFKKLEKRIVTYTNISKMALSDKDVICFDRQAFFESESIDCGIHRITGKIAGITEKVKSVLIPIYYVHDAVHEYSRTEGMLIAEALTDLLIMDKQVVFTNGSVFNALNANSNIGEFARSVLGRSWHPGDPAPTDIGSATPEEAHKVMRALAKPELDKNMVVRVSEQDKSLIETKATENGFKSVSEYLRFLALNATIERNVTVRKVNMSIADLEKEYACPTTNIDDMTPISSDFKTPDNIPGMSIPSKEDAEKIMKLTAEKMKKDKILKSGFNHLCFQSAGAEINEIYNKKLVDEQLTPEEVKAIKNEHLEEHPEEKVVVDLDVGCD